MKISNYSTNTQADLATYISTHLHMHVYFTKCSVRIMVQTKYGRAKNSERQICMLHKRCCRSHLLRKQTKEATGQPNTDNHTKPAAKHKSAQTYKYVCVIPFPIPLCARSCNIPLWPCLGGLSHSCVVACSLLSTSQPSAQPSATSGFIHATKQGEHNLELIVIFSLIFIITRFLVDRHFASIQARNKHTPTLLRTP